MLTLIRTDPYAHLARVATLSVPMADSRLKPVPHALARRMPGGTVLVNLESNRIFELNETGARVWELLGEGLEPDRDFRAPHRGVCGRFSPRSSEADSLLDHLEGEGLLGT